MIGGTVTHLLPSVSPVAVRTEQPQIATVGFPIAQAIVPGSRTPLLQTAINVVNVEDAKVALPAIHARSSKLGNERQLPTPVARVLVTFVGVGRPVGVTTGYVAKAVLARLSALFASLGALPSGGEVAGLSAVFPAAVSQAIKVHLERFGAMRAYYFDGALFHRQSIAQSASEPKYFDIACKRIEDAQRQGDFFVDAAA